MKTKWRFTKIETPKIGEYVWVCNKNDKKAKLIKWFETDLCFYSYWIPANAPKPPQDK